MNIIREIKALDLPAGEYVVIGSGPLAIRGIRSSDDIDLIVTHKLYEALKASGWQPVQFPFHSSTTSIRHGIFEADLTWTIENSYDPDPQQLINNADIIDGVAFARLADIRTWKVHRGRDKDIRDIGLIDTYLASHTKR